MNPASPNAQPRGSELSAPATSARHAQSIIVSAFIFLLALLMVDALLSYNATRATNIARDRVEHTYQVIGALDNVHLDLLNAEARSTQRTARAILFSNCFLLVLVLITGGLLFQALSRPARATDIASSPPATGTPAWLAYAAAIAGTALAAFLRWGLGAMVGETLPPFITFYPVVIFAALLGGLGPGLFATALSALAVDFLFLAPIGAFGPMRAVDQVGIVLFCGVNIMVSLVAGALRSARTRAIAEARRAALSEQRFRLFMDNTPTLVWVKDEQGHYLFLNKAYEQRFRRLIADCQGKTDDQLWDPATAARLRQADQQALAAGHPIELTEETTEADGTASFWHNTKFTFLDQSGRRFVASLGLDITPRQRAEDALKVSEQRYRSFVEATNQVIWRTNSRGEVDQSIPSWNAFTGQTDEQAAGFGWMNAIHPDDRPRVTQAWRAANAGKTTYQVEYRLRRHDGRWLHILARGVPILEPDGSIREYIGACNDITTQREAEEDLRHQARLLNLSPTATIVRSLEGVIRFWSAGAQALYGWTAEEALGRRTYDLFQTEFPKPLHDIISDLRRGGKWSGELRQRTKDGSQVVVESHWLGQFAADGQVVELMESNMDITARQQAENALRQSERRLRVFFDSDMFGALYWNTRGEITEANDKFLQMVGYSREDLQGRPLRWVELTPSEHRAADEQSLTQIAARGVNTPYEKEFTRKDGSRIPVIIGAASFDERRQQGVAFVIDNTARKRAQEQLRASEERLRKAISTPTVGVLFFNLDGRIHEANAAFQRMSGYTAEELRTLHWKVLTAPERWDATARAAQEVASRGETAPYEKEMVRKDGSRWWGLFAPMRLSGRGTTSECMEFIVDTTEQRRAQETLQRRNHHLQLLHQASARLLVGQQPVELLRELHAQIAQAFGADAFMLYQADPGDHRLHLLACAGVTEDQRHQLESLRYGRAVCATPAAALQPIIATHLQNREAPNRRFVRKLGFRSYLYYPLILNHYLHGTVAFASHTRDDYDATDLDFFHTIAGTLAEALERDRLAKQLARHAADLEKVVRERTAKLRETIAELEGFSYSLVHDMRAPLRAMNAYATILEEEVGPRLQPAETDLLRKLKTSCNRMDQLVTDSLNYSKILRQDLPLGPVKLGELLRGMVETYPNLHQPQAEVCIELGELTVHGNASALTQVFSNLLGNAVKFVAPGVHPRVRVWAELVDSGELRVERAAARAQAHTSPGYQLSTSNPQLVRVCVEDNGIGIPHDQQEKIFGMFQRMHRENEYPGTGIGLALVKKSLERTGGLITVESEPGRGSRFYVQLPLATPEPAAQQVAA